MSFAIYLVGFLVLIGGLIYAATLMHVATQWIVVGAVIMLGLALVKAVPATRTKIRLSASTLRPRKNRLSTVDPNRHRAVSGSIRYAVG